MPRLKSREKFPPGEFQVLHPEAGMKKPYQGSFRECVAWEVMWRRKNKALSQSLGLPDDQSAVEVYVDEYNAQRCISHGYFNFVEMDGAPQPSAKKNLLGRVVGVVEGGKAAISAYMAMFGKQGPVHIRDAENRASVCATCKQNDVDTGITGYFVRSTATEIMSLLSSMKDLDLKVREPNKLGICKLCMCPMNAKVFAPLDNILEHMPADVWPQLPDHCWMKQEKK